MGLQRGLGALTPGVAVWYGISGAANGDNWGGINGANDTFFDKGSGLQTNMSSKYNAFNSLGVQVNVADIALPWFNSPLFCLFACAHTKLPPSRGWLKTI